MTSVLDQQVSGQASAMGSKGDGGGDPPGKKPSDVGREHQEEASEDYIPLEYHVGENETCSVCGKHKSPHKQLKRCKICGRVHAAKCRELESEKHSTKNHPNRAKSATDDAAAFGRFLAAAYYDLYGGVTKPGQGRGQRRGQNRGSGRGRGRGQRGGQRGGSGRGQSRGQGGGGGRGRGKADPKQEDGSQGTAPRKGNQDDDTQM